MAAPAGWKWLCVARRGAAGKVTLDPRQELTGAPAALSLALPFYAEANIGGPLVSLVNTSGDGEAALFSSQVSALFVESAGQDGLYVASAGQNGVHVDSAGYDGVAVGMAGNDGVFVHAAGNPSGYGISTYRNGFEVSGAEGYGLFVGHADLDGVTVLVAGNPSARFESTHHNGLEVAGAEGDGLYVGRADGDGVFVNSAGGTGVYVDSTAFSGVHVDSAGYDGVVVHEAGSSSTAVYSTQNNGFEVAGAQGYGLYVGRADLDGVYVNSTAWHGLNVANAGVNGLYVSTAGYAGVDVAGNTWAGNFHGDINVSGACSGCARAVFGLNAGDQPLEPGQVVAIQGIQTTTLDDAPALWRVVPAGEGSAAVGVVRGKAELDEAPDGATLREGETGQRLVPRSGAAQPGDYLTLVVYGPMQVKAGAADGAIEPGTRLAVGQAGAARALKTVVVEGLTLAESAPSIGIALTAPDEDGLVWVLVNPQ